jgi:uncharacterized protein (TIGR02996 family)
MSTLESLYESLVQSQNDWQARSVLADWFEESGQQHAADAIRWMIRASKRPYRASNGTYHWFNAGRATNDADPESDLPEAVYVQMTAKEGLAMSFRDYDTLRAADEDFYLAWRAARDKGWADDA